MTNPPIDPIREELVMSLTSYIGTERNILEETPEHCHTLKLEHPILTNWDLEKLRRVSQGIYSPRLYPRFIVLMAGNRNWSARSIAYASRASFAIKSGYSLLILRTAMSITSRRRFRVCSRLPQYTTTSSAKGSRTQVALIVESGEPREVQHFCSADRLRSERGQSLSCN